MRVTSGFSLLASLLPGLFGIALAAPAQAADEDSQLWLTGNVVVPADEAFTGTLEISQRFRESSDQVLVRAGVDYRLSQTVSLNGGAVVTNAGGVTEFRPQQQVTLSFGPLALRSRAEQRFFEGADRMEVRLRQRAQFGVPVADGLRAAVSGELFYIARSRDAGGESGIEQWRLNTTLTQRLSERLDATLGYLFIATPRPAAPDGNSHVAQIALTWRL